MESNPNKIFQLQLDGELGPGMLKCTNVSSYGQGEFSSHENDAQYIREGPRCQVVLVCFKQLWPFWKAYKMDMQLKPNKVVELPLDGE